VLGVVLGAGREWQAGSPVSIWTDPAGIVQRPLPPELHTGAPVLLLEDRLGEETEDDTVRALKDDVLGHARWRFNAAELAIERSHPADVSTGERNCADPRRESHGGDAVYACASGDFAHAGPGERQCSAAHAAA
jgi:hypothetical protein